MNVGMNVMVNMAGFSRGGISLGAGASAGGTIIDISASGVTVKLHGAIAGVDVVTVPPGRITPA